MDDGYMIGPKEVVFQVLANFVKCIREECGCDLNVSKCKMYNEAKGTCEEARRAGCIPAVLSHIQEGTFVNWAGDVLRGLANFNVPVGEERYVTAKLRNKAGEVEQTTRSYVKDLEEEYPQELWV